MNHKNPQTSLDTKLADTSTPKIKKEPQAAKPKPKTPNGAKLDKASMRLSGILIVGFFILLNFGGLAYVWLVNDQQNSSQQVFNQQYQQQLNSKSTQLSKLQQQLKDQKKQKQTTLKQIKQKIEAINNTILTMQSQLNLTQQKINQSQRGVNQELLSSEADFLIRTAAIRLLLTHNTNETTNLLKAADKRLLKINDVAIFPVRAALNKDLYQLKATPQIDIIGSYLKLAAMAESLNKLKVNFILPQQETKENLPLSKDPSWLGHFSQSANNVINKWFQVSHYDEKIKPLVSLQQDEVIKRSITLLSKQAQWSLVQNNLKLYQMTLNNLTEQIKSSFNQQDPVVKKSLVEIKALLASSMVAAPMTYLNSEKAMQSYIQATNEDGIKP